MSRSYKKYPFKKDIRSSKWGKKLCNRVVRKSKDIPKGKGYKKLTEKWDYIYDYTSSETWKSYQKWCKATNVEAVYYKWYRFYIAK